MYVNLCANHCDVHFKKNIVVKHMKFVFKKTEKYMDFFVNMRKTLRHLTCMFSNKL